MKLDDFIFESIKQVVDGIEKAQEYAQTKGANISGDKLGWVGAKNGAGIVFYNNSTGEVIEKIDFDIAVSIKDGDKKKVGAGLFVGPLNFGASGESDIENSSISRLRFSVPLHLPKTKK